MSHARLSWLPLVIGCVLLSACTSNSSVNLPQSSGWTYVMPGYVQAIAFAQTAPQVAYLCGAERGNMTVRRSTDGAATWSNPVTVGVGRLCAVAVDPSNPQSLALTSYLCPGCYGGASSNQQAYTSSDGGNTWTPIAQAPAWSHQGCPCTVPTGAPPLDNILAIFQSPDGTAIASAGLGAPHIYAWRAGQTAWTTLPISLDTTPQNYGFELTALQSDAAGRPIAVWGSLIALVPGSGCGDCQQKAWYLLRHPIALGS